jgi:hypothetical protein
MPGATRYKNRPLGSRPWSFSLLLSPEERRVLDKLTKTQDISRTEAFRRALEAYARSALSFDEYRDLYPVE